MTSKHALSCEEMEDAPVVKRACLREEEDEESYWDWLPPEMAERIQWLADRMTARERLDRGWSRVHKELEELPRCRIHGTRMGWDTCSLAYMLDDCCYCAHDDPAHQWMMNLRRHWHNP